MDKQVAEHIKAAKQSGLDGTAEFIRELVDSHERLKEKYKDEVKKNAYISVTGKSIKGIWSDGIVDAIETLCPDYNENSKINVGDLLQHSVELAHQ
ncbi:hypothetical protein [Thalassotalea piscium]|uniref:Uncharacterized protein n=1 Tax=Thalassotalea piscium TaxID=1230533 RepID=A0A7X0NJZ0_9GAMM|nr:hypothetical protein [Thalassotalea piscium]MBB6544796.1 hypothetical protein [Thalassotalea piscium]